LAINGFALIFGFPMPIIFALMLNELRQRKFKKWVQTVTYLPHFVSWVIVAGLFYFLLDETTGVVNDFIEAAGGNRVAFFRRADLFWPLIILAAIWKEIGWSSIIYLAALSSIDPNLYEAARIDGANKWQEIWNITLPGLLPTISVLLIITTGRILIGGGLIPSFQAVWNMANPMLSETSETIGIHTYLVGVRQGKYAYGTAAGLFQSFVAFVFVFGSNFLAKKFKGYGVV
jgi:putative aldouronate transport system permease protein